MKNNPRPKRKTKQDKFLLNIDGVVYEEISSIMCNIGHEKLICMKTKECKDCKYCLQQYIVENNE